jgi:hypothetical protein
VGHGGRRAGGRIPFRSVNLRGLTIHSSRTRFVPAKGGTEKRATFCLHYAGRLNSGVRPLGGASCMAQSDTVVSLHAH